MVIQRVEDLPDLSVHKGLVFDVETSGFEVHHGDRICGVVIGGAASDDGFYLPLRHSADSLDARWSLEELADAVRIPPTDRLSLPPAPYKNLPLEPVFRWLQDLGKDPNKVWIAHNAKFDLGMLRADGVEIAGRIYDTMVVGHVHNGNLWDYELTTLTFEFLRGVHHPWEKVLKAYLSKTQPKSKTLEGNAPQNYSRIPVQLLGPYALEDLHTTRQLANHLKDRPLMGRIPNQGLPAWTQKELLDHELKLLKVIWDMEWHGVLLDKKRCIELRDKTEGEIEGFKKKMFEIVGYEFNPGSWKQMQDALEKAGAQVLYWMKPELKKAHEYPHLERGDFRTKQKMEQYTTDKDKSTGRPCWNAMAVLDYLKVYKKSGNKRAYELLRCLREVDTRSLQLSMYIKNYLKMVDYNGRIHGRFNQHGTVTGRLSAMKPNLQNVSKAKGTADQMAFEAFFGEKDEEAINRKLRGLFIAPPGHLLVSQDYSGIEYRMASYLATDPDMKKKYMENPDLDYHQLTADETGIPRDQAKTVNFGVLYGMMAKGLASALTGFGFPTSKVEAQSYLTRVFAARPSIKDLIEVSQQVAAKLGHVRNFGGRVCPVPKGREYVALNYMDQGSCGEIMRYALVKVYEYIQDNKLPIQLLITVHDEIVWEAEEVVALAHIKPIEAIMCDVPFVDIPLLVETEVGYTWGAQEEYSKWLIKNEKRIAG